MYEYVWLHLLARYATLRYYRPRGIARWILDEHFSTLLRVCLLRGRCRIRVCAGEFLLSEFSTALPPMTVDSFSKAKMFCRYFTTVACAIAVCAIAIDAALTFPTENLADCGLYDSADAATADLYEEYKLRKFEKGSSIRFCMSNMLGVLSMKSGKR